MRVKQIELRCIYCRHGFTADIRPPESWVVKRYPLLNEYRFLCPECGAFAYPFELCPDNEAPYEDLYRMFAVCENAWQCDLCGLYGPDCENNVLKTKCLRHIFLEIEQLSDRLEDIEKRFPPQGKAG